MLKRLFIVTLLSQLLLSCAKPTEPESVAPSTGGYAVVGRLRTPGFPQDVVIKDSLAYVAQGEGGLLIVNIADPVRPRIVSLCQDGVRGYSYKVAMKDSAVYIAASSFGVNVISVRNPAAPVATASNLAMKPARSFKILGNYLFTSLSESGVKIADISQPTLPDIRGGIQPPGYAHGMTTTTDSAYLLIACGEMGLAVYDIRDMQSGFGSYRQVGWTDTPGYAVDVVTMGSRPIAFLACGTAGVQVVDFSDTTNIRVVNSYSTGGYAKEIAYLNGRVYVTTELRGLQILAADNAGGLRLIGVVHTEYAMGLALNQHHVYVADEVEGLIVIAIPAN